MSPTHQAQTTETAASKGNPTILEVDHLSIAYPISIGVVRAVEEVSITLADGEALGLVGESGCGKSTLGLSILKLLRPPGRVTAGAIRYRGNDILGMSGQALLALRGQNIAMIFQNPLTSLNPLFTVERHFLETIHFHDPGMSKAKARAGVEKILETLGIERKRLAEYPHQLSGGMRQRIMIGLALIMNPDILIADEPTTSLDVIVEAGFTDLLTTLRDLYKLSIILITHNLGLVAEIADRIAVMYGGKIMEVATAREIFAHPLHPYTQGLIACVPNILLDQKDLTTMPGMPPDLVQPPPGCRFAARCARVMPICRQKEPPLRSHAPAHHAACWLYGTRD
ncbi:MAG TPA: ABC transporter ATP-binding protein [Spirochaetia bacterium]|nr:ABC transporter ATP-binding protein [Spirochaetia bacterium]